MAKNEENQTVEEKKIDLSPRTVESIETGSLAIAPYSPNAVAEFGNKFLTSLVMAASAEEEAQKQLAAAGEAKQFLSFEMTKAIADLADRFAEGKDAVDVYAVFGEPKDVEKLNTRVLIHMGVMKREIGDDDTVRYVWTEENVEKLYSYTKELKETNPEEYQRRFNNRKRLNMRLSEAYKAVVALRDAKLSADDLYYSEDADTGAMVPTIRNAPKEIGGENGTVQMNQRKVVKGATLSPTMTSLVKLATDRHKPKADRADKGENREGEAKLGMNDEAFGGIVNTLRRAVTAQEGNFTPDMQKQLKALADFLVPVIKSFK